MIYFINDSDVAVQSLATILILTKLVGIKYNDSIAAYITFGYWFDYLFLVAITCDLYDAQYQLYLNSCL